MRRLFTLVLPLCVLFCGTARADTVLDNFVFTYTLAGVTQTESYSLAKTILVSTSFAGQYSPSDPAADLGDSGYADTFLPFLLLDVPGLMSRKSPVVGFRFGTFFHYGNPSTGTNGLTELTSDAGTYSLFNAYVQLPDGQGVPLSNVSLTIAETSTPAPIPTFAAATPEPSALLLAGTGLLGMAGAVRRRMASAS